ncbi:MAG: Oligopeptide-binding protein AppA [Alphaproteobacteria bacterium MarineAlpha4_Bin2]|nr:MAG: Oligopeptide-binding protein AppA [Alphaproteobacteria bacterium MarineAlpha4_Bin2]
MRFIFALIIFLMEPWPLSAGQRELVIGVSQFPANFNPLINSMLAKSYMLALARRPITVYGSDWQLMCMLCTELPDIAKGTAVFETTEDGKPGIAVTYRLDPNAVWGDGTPITTKDVIFTWEVGRHALSGVGDADTFRRITKIDAHDEKSFTLHINKRTCDYAGINGLDLLPAHLERANFAQPREYRNRSAYERQTTNPGLWFGPYRVAEVVAGAYAVFERNSRWWGRKPHFDRIIIKAIDSTAAMTANLLSGDIDYIAGELGLSIDQAMAFERRADDRFNFIYKPGLIYEHIDVNLDVPALQDRRVRQALLHAVDRDAISMMLFGGHQPVAHGQTNPLDAVYNRKIPKYAYDPVKAATLLEDAGWTRASVRDIRRNADGKPLRFVFMTTAGNKTRELIQQVLQSQWRKAGVDARIRNQPPRVYFGETVTKRKFRGLAMYAWLSAPGNIPRSTLHSEMIPNESNGWSGQNYPGYSNPEVDKLLDDVETVCEPKSNQTLWNKLQNIYSSDLPVLPLYFRATPFIIPNWLKGMQPTGHQYTSTLWIEDWFTEGRPGS